jgi:hypothetical protein
MLNDGDSPTSGMLRLWWEARRAERQRVRQEAQALHEHFGPAAAIIAQSSARQIVGFEMRRFWRRVARRVARAR